MKEYHRNESARMFQNNFFERASRVQPWVPFAFYIPIITVATGSALYLGTTHWRMLFVALPLGWLTWSLMEYSLHRYFFHWTGNGPFTRRLHDIIHGYHHKYPDDEDRLVMPLGASIPLALAIIGILWLFHAPSFTVPYFSGIVAGYLFYDFTHWSTHFRTPLTEWGRQVRSHHMAHHFAVPDKNFGISHRWLDRIVGSLKHRTEK
jgi:dihydroceramide fatty acyl 2-hydroxylase